jgi:site-specific DNA-methyltransferase (adenine-specific)
MEFFCKLEESIAKHKWEKSCGKHPTQKPLSVLTRIILASTKQKAWILDPFTGSSTTGIAANLLERKFLGIDVEEEYLRISKNRKLEIENEEIFSKYCKKLQGFKKPEQLEVNLIKEPKVEYEPELDLTNILKNDCL